LGASGSAVRTLSLFLILLSASSFVQVQGRLSSSGSSSSHAPSDTGTYLTQQHLQSIASFDPANPPQRPRTSSSRATSTSSARDLQTSPTDNAKCRPLQIAEWLRLLQSETDAEFDITEEVAEAAGVDPTLLLARAQLMWQDTTDFEWDRAIAATAERNLPAPFVVCMEQPSLQGRLQSGFRRRKFVRDRIRDAISDMGGDEVWRKVILRTLYNGDDMFCVYSLMDAAVAQNIDFDGCAVQPMTMSMKLMPRTVQMLLDKVKECKDEIDSKTDRNNGSDRQRQRREQDTVLDLLLSDSDVNGNGDVLDCDALNVARPAADIILCPGSLTYNQISALGAGDPSYIVASLTSKKGNQASSIAEQVYWTSTEAEQYRRTESARAEYWREALEEAGSFRCNTVIETKLQWSVRHSDDGDFSVLRVVYDASTAEQWESGCVGSLIAGLAVRQDVCGLEIAADIGVSNYNANWMVQSGVQDETPWTDVGLDGEGQVVALSDTGIDVNNCYFYDADYEKPSEYLDTNGHRNIAMYRSYADDKDEELGHGTHVGAIIVGNRAPDGKSEESGVANGIAPAAKLAFIDISSTAGQLSPPNDNEVLSTGRVTRDRSSPAAHIHSMSWGSKNVFYYNNAARMFDNFMFANDDFLAVVAAGNEGLNDKETSVGAPGNAKNVLSVGASHSFGDDLEQSQLGPSYVADFSSRGPTSDGRICPDVVAPGKYILSAAARPNNPGACDPRNGDIPEPSGDTDGLYSQAGSSMSAPLVAGSAALIRQYFEEGWHGDGAKGSESPMSPSGALVKAVLINGAQADLIGVDNGRKGITEVKPYDNNQGFGRVSLVDSVYIKGKTDVSLKYWDLETLFDGDAAKTYQVRINKSRGCDADVLSVTLAWIEEGSAPGCTKCLLNDLDLYITEDGRESVRYHPNGRSIKDDVNNVERVVIDGVNDGSEFTIHVDPYNLNSLSQKYAVVATGCFGGVANEIDTSKNVFLGDSTSVRSGGEGDGGSTNNTTKIIIIVCASCGGAIALCLGLALLRRFRQKDKKGKSKKKRKRTEEQAPSIAELRRGKTG